MIQVRLHNDHGKETYESDCHPSLSSDQVEKHAVVHQDAILSNLKESPLVPVEA